jgi:hypothetical protein
MGDQSAELAGGFPGGVLEADFPVREAATKYSGTKGEANPKIDELGRFPNLFTSTNSKAQAVEKLSNEIDGARREVEKIGLKYGVQAGLSRK